MKKSSKLRVIVIILLLALVLLIVFALNKKKEELTFDGKEGKITFTVTSGKGYKISENKEDLRTSREQAALVGKDFKIGIEFVDDYNYFFESNLDKMKEARKDYDDYKEVNYGGVDGIQYFYSGYNCYEIMLPVKDNDKYYLDLTVYGKEDKEEAAKKAISNKEVLEILNSIKFEAK